MVRPSFASLIPRSIAAMVSESTSTLSVAGTWSFRSTIAYSISFSGRLCQLHAADAGDAIEFFVEGGDPFDLVIQHDGGVDGMARKQCRDIRDQGAGAIGIRQG